MDLELKGKVAIVTGAAQGIGKGIALVLAAEGAKVAIADMNMEGAAQVVDEIKAKGSKAIAIKVDVTDMNNVLQMVKEVEAKLGKVDILVNNVGITPPGARNKFFWEKTPEQSNSVVQTTFVSVMNCCRAVIEGMIERRSGKIVSISATSGLTGTIKSAEYSACKAAVIGFTKVLAKEVAPYNINVNSVCPGPILTESMEKFAPEKQKEEFRKLTGFGRMGKPEDIGYMTAFLASDKANYITGHDYVVGGLIDLGGN